MGSELGLVCVGIYDGDQRERAEKVRGAFQFESNVTVLTLARNDIRDKYRRDGKCVKTGKCAEIQSEEEIVIRGYFDRDGNIHEDAREEFDALIAEIRAALTAEIEQANLGSDEQNIVQFGMPRKN